MGRPKEHGAATREALLEAALRVLNDEGASGLTVRRLAEDVGVSTRAVYSLYGGKEAVLSALYRESFERLAARIEAHPKTDDPVFDLVDLGLTAFRSYALENENLFRLVFERLVPSLNPSDADRQVGRRCFSKLVDRVRRVSDAGLLGGRDPVQVAFQYHATAQGLVATELLGWLAPFDAERVWRDTLAALVRGLADPTE